MRYDAEVQVACENAVLACSYTQSSNKSQTDGGIMRGRRVPRIAEFQEFTLVYTQCVLSRSLQDGNKPIGFGSCEWPKPRDSELAQRDSCKLKIKQR